MGEKRQETRDKRQAQSNRDNRDDRFQAKRRGRPLALVLVCSPPQSPLPHLPVASLSHRKCRVLAEPTSCNGGCSLDVGTSSCRSEQRAFAGLAVGPELNKYHIILLPLLVLCYSRDPVVLHVRLPGRVGGNPTGESAGSPVHVQWQIGHSHHFLFRLSYTVAMVDLNLSLPIGSEFRSILTLFRHQFSVFAQFEADPLSRSA